MHLFPLAVAPTIPESPLWKDPLSEEAVALRKKLTDEEKGKTVVRAPRPPDTSSGMETGGGVTVVGGGAGSSFFHPTQRPQEQGEGQGQNQGQGQGQGLGYSSTQRQQSYQSSQSYPPHDFYNVQNEYQGETQMPTSSSVSGSGSGSGFGSGRTVYRPYDSDAGGLKQQYGAYSYSEREGSAQKINQHQQSPYGERHRPLATTPSNHSNHAERDTSDRTGGGSDADPLQYMS